jgi:hypothetical protein
VGARRALPRLDEPERDPLVRHPLEHLGGVAHLHPEADAGVEGPVARHQRRQDVGGGVHRGAHHDLLLDGGLAPEVRLERREEVADLVRRLEQPEPPVGGRDAAGGAQEQRPAALLLEGADLRGDGRLREVEQLGRRGHLARLRHDAEGLELPRVDPSHA